MSGLLTLIRLILRRDRVKLPLWIGIFVLGLLAMIPLLRDVYGSEESLQVMYATLAANPAGLFMTGPMDGPTFGSLMTLETLLWWGLAIAFLNTLLVVRHTRHNEEIGAQELLLSGQVHRASSLVAVLIVALGVNVLITIALGLGMNVMDTGWGAEQSWLFAISMGTVGFVWAGIAAVVVQLVESGRSANGILAGLIGASFVVRGIGDFLGKADNSGLLQPHWVSNLSPFGWLQATRPLTESEWSPLLISLGFVVVAIASGFMLLAGRDVGAGLLPSRKGRRRASRLLGTPLGLTLYLQKNIFIGWFVAVLVLAATIGMLVPQMSEIYSNNDSISQMLAISGSDELTAAFLSMMLAIVCVMVFAYAIHGLGKLRGEEASGRLESVLATRVSRLKWLGMHFDVVAIGGSIMLAATGLVLALCVNTLSDLTVDVWEYVLAGLAYAPVMLVFMGLYVLLFGLLPRLAGAVAWLYFGFVAFALWLGPIIKLDKVVMDISIMEHVAMSPVEAIAWQPLAVITTIAVGLIVIGLAVFRHRDVTS